jgi:hypothetical protein
MDISILVLSTCKIIIIFLHYHQFIIILISAKWMTTDYPNKKKIDIKILFSNLFALLEVSFAARERRTVI